MNQEARSEITEKQASEWFVLMHSGEATAADRAAFQTWLHEDRRNKAAFQVIEQVYRDLDFVLADPEVAGIEESAGASRKPFWHSVWPMPRGSASGIAAAAALLVVCSVSFFFWRAATVPGVQEAEAPMVARSSYSTTIGEVRDITLEDGSVISLGGDSGIDVAYSADRRSVRLDRGEAFFAVAENPERPFFVASQDTIVRVVGTKFDVKRSDDTVHVAVLEGRVEVAKGDSLAKPQDYDMAADKRILTAGERLSAARQVALPVEKQMEVISVGEWRTGRLSYEDASLAEIVDDVSRYVSTRILLQDDGVGNLRSTMAFKADNLTQFLEIIQAIHPVDVAELNDGTVIIAMRS